MIGLLGNLVPTAQEPTVFCTWASRVGALLLKFRGERRDIGRGWVCGFPYAEIEFWRRLEGTLLSVGTYYG